MSFKITEHSIEYQEEEKDILNHFLIYGGFGLIGLILYWLHLQVTDEILKMVLLLANYAILITFIISTVAFAFEKKKNFIFKQESFLITDKSNRIIDDIPIESLTEINKTVYLRIVKEGAPLLDFILYLIWIEQRSQLFKFEINNKDYKTSQEVLDNSESIDDFINKYYPVTLTIKDYYLR